MPSLKSLVFGAYAFTECSRVVFENLPELESIQMGEEPFMFKQYDVSSTLIMRNLPKLTTLTVLDVVYAEGSIRPSYTFRYPRHIILESIPIINNVTLSSDYAFEYKDDVTIRGDIGGLQRYFN